MTNSAGQIGQSERHTQQRVIALFRDELHYRYLGDWSERTGNSNIEPTLLGDWLAANGNSPAHISRAIDTLQREANNHNRELYDNNQAVYKLLRYGVQVKTDAGKPTDTVHLINWREPHKNDFAIAEEVTLKGTLERRPDLVLYVNGIAVGVLELKNSRVSIAEGIRQNLSNQQPAFNAWFFSTVQFVFAGSDAEGLQYGTTGTPDKYFLKWKEDEADNRRSKLDKYLLKMCDKMRLLELMHDFVLFDGGQKKLPRVHQYFGIKAAQEHVRQRKSGIIWHTQGAGKSILMVLLAKWILENNPHARIVIVTDRDELDKQIERVFLAAGEKIARCKSSRALLQELGQATPRMLCTLVHKFGRNDVDDIEQFIKELESQPPATVGELFVFVDECHRTQGGKLHAVMKAMMRDAVFIGFTGTPLLKQDAKNSLEVFGGYIHTYKFSEAVDDGVVLDLMYEARDIDQQISSQKHIDQWFETKTKGLNDWQKDELKKQWGTMRNVLSARSRMDCVVADIVFDFSTKRRLSDQKGNAILVAASIYDACKYFTLFNATSFKHHCAIVTSYNPQARDITLEETGAHTETDKQFIFNTYTALLQHVDAQPGKSKTETYVDQSKALFINEPARMKLLIVVDKLLTGFDAPPCTYLYIDKSMQDHGLFQAICRTNRLDGDDKDFGYVVDYKDLFKKVENAIAVYTSELATGDGAASTDILLKDRLKVGRDKLDSAVEAVALLLEQVEPPKDEAAHIRYFCGNVEIATDLMEHAPQRVTLYRQTVALLRAYANIADEMDSAGYSAIDIKRIKQHIDDAIAVRSTVRLASGESLDLKSYEADMRHLLDTYIRADAPRKISPFDDIGLVDLIVKSGVADAIAAQLGAMGGNRDAIAETIDNNVRSTIIKEQLTDPAYYEKMSALLEEIIVARRAKAIDYETYLARIATLAKQVKTGHDDTTHEKLKQSAALRAVYNSLQKNAARFTQCAQAADDDTEDPILNLAVRVDRAIRQARPDDWRGFAPKENRIKTALLPVLGGDMEAVLMLFPIIVAQRSEY